MSEYVLADSSCDALSASQDSVIIHKYIIGQKFDTLLFLNIAYLLLIKPLFTWSKIQNKINIVQYYCWNYNFK